MCSGSYLLEIIQAIIANYFSVQKPKAEINLINNTGINQIVALQSETVLINYLQLFLTDELSKTKHNFMLLIDHPAADVVEVSLLIDGVLQKDTLCINILSHVALDNNSPKGTTNINLLTEDESLSKSCTTLMQSMNDKYKLKFILCNSAAKRCVELEDLRHLNSGALMNRLQEDSHDSHLKICTFAALADLDEQNQFSSWLLVWPFFDTDLIELLRVIPKASKLSVLVADDSLPSQITTQVMLESLGCVVTCVDNGTQALDLALEKPFDLLLLDERMPGLFGSDVIKYLTQHSTPNDNTPKVVLTGLTCEEQIAELFIKGATHYLQKPVTKAILETFIKSWQTI